MDILTQISTWAAPPLLGAVIYFVIKKFDDSEKTLDLLKKTTDHNKNTSDEKLNAINDKLSTTFIRLREDLNKTSQLIVNVQTTMNNEVLEMSKAATEMKVSNVRVEKWLEDSRIHHGRIIHLDSSVQRHDQILVTSAKIMKNHNERLHKTEGDIINLSKKKVDDEGA